MTMPLLFATRIRTLYPSDGSHPRIVGILPIMALSQEQIDSYALPSELDYGYGEISGEIITVIIRHEFSDEELSLPC